MKTLAIYIHWPFCLSKCPYCDFNSRVMPQGEDEKKWAANYGREISFYAQKLSDRKITSLYFGGGTPSLMNAATVAAVIDKIAALWPMVANCEITLEANPTSSEMEKFKSFRTAGVNRLSLGVQSLNDDALRFLGRTHDAAGAIRAIESAASVFDRFSFDLIYARAGQTPKMWEEELGRALSFNPRHLSLYQLTLEEGSIFYKRPDRESLIVSEDVSVDLFDMTQNITEKAGLPAYEISNHAQTGQESRHNLTYWHYDDYIGIGPGAHGRYVDLAGQRWATENHRHPVLWGTQCDEKKQGAALTEIITPDTAMKEALLMGLRLSKGIDKEMWQNKFSIPLDHYLNQKALKTLEQEGLITQTDQNIAPTSEGRKKLNAVIKFLFK